MWIALWDSVIIVCFVAYCTFANVEVIQIRIHTVNVHTLALYTYCVLQLVVSKQVSHAVPLICPLVIINWNYWMFRTNVPKLAFLILFNQIYDSFVFLDRSTSIPAFISHSIGRNMLSNLRLIYTEVIRKKKCIVVPEFNYICPVLCSLLHRGV